MNTIRYLSEMDKLFTLLPVFLILSSCNGQVKSTWPQDSSEIQRGEPISIPDFLPDTNPPVEDPYFILTKDTFSTHGPHSITRNILQDRNGNFWFATWEGIIGYDGQHFTNYTLKDKLKRFHVFSVLEDRTGNLWFGTIGGGVYRYDPSAKLKPGDKSFTLFTTADGLANNIITCMLEDKAGNIWFGTDGGVSRYNPLATRSASGKMFTNYSIKDGLSGTSVNSITQDKTGRLWFGTRGGDKSDVSYYDPLIKASGKPFTLFTNSKGVDFSNVRSIIEDKAGNIWIGGQTGLYRYNGKIITSISTNFIGYIVEDSHGNIWLSESEGNGMALTKYDGKTFARIKSDEQVFGITEDKAGYIWFGTVNGIFRYDPSPGAGGQSFTNFN